jgi:hypothetical protein
VDIHIYDNTFGGNVHGNIQTNVGYTNATGYAPPSPD